MALGDLLFDSLNEDAVRLTRPAAGFDLEFFCLVLVVFTELA